MNEVLPQTSHITSSNFDVVNVIYYLPILATKKTRKRFDRMILTLYINIKASLISCVFVTNFSLHLNITKLRVMYNQSRYDL